MQALRRYQVSTRDGLRDCQIKAITNLETSLKSDKPRALVQMATGSGKTFTAITQVYRLLKHAGARRILFLVDTKNLGEQAEQEFMAFIPNDDNRKFTELYNVQRLTSPSIANDSQVVISTIQRMYATLKGEELNEGAEDENPAEQKWRRKEPLPVVYNAKLPPEYFDVVVIDECHRSIYNLWRQVIEYFDVYLIGLTATPDNRTYGFFQKNVVSEYTHEKAVADKVNVGNEIYLIETEITQGGETLKAEQLVEKRERETRARRWETQDEEEAYAATPARPIRRQSRPDPHRHPHIPRQVARDLPRPQGTAENPDLRQDGQPRRRHHPDRPAGVRRGQRFLPQDHQRGQEPEILAQCLPQRLLPAHCGDR